MPKTELIWEGKYDANGRKRGPVKVSLPFQTVETVNESAQERRTLFSALDREQPWRNRLIWGDKKFVLPSLLDEFAGKVNLIYIDPPFDTGADFSFTAAIPDGPDGEDGADFVKQPSVIEQKAYRDTWGRGIDSYLQWFYETVVLLHDLLADDGSIYVHLDWHVGHYAKCALDEVFGGHSFINDITWMRSHAHGDTGQGAKHFGRITDRLLYYVKNSQAAWNAQYLEYSDEALERDYKYEESDGRRYRLAPVDGPGGAAKGNPVYEFLGVTGAWRFSKLKMQSMYEQGLVVLSSTGRSLSQKKYLDTAKGKPVTDLWNDVWRVSPTSSERVAYATQKPESLLDRIIRASSNEGDLVLDCFCGSGTTAAVAERLNRRWITCDLGRFAVHTARKRLLSVPGGVRPFVVQNLGKYELQQWHAGQFDGDAAQADKVQRAYREFMLRLYHAEPLSGGYAWLHGQKGGRFVHVGGVDGPVTAGDVAKIAAEFRKGIGTGADAPTTNGVDVLGWEFAFEINEVSKQQAADANIAMRFRRIPRDVMDKRAVAEGGIQFFEMAALEVVTKVQGLKAEVQLAGFVIPPDDVPEEVRDGIRHWSQWIDFWAVDWDHQPGGTFHNEWQTFRTKREPKLSPCTSHTYTGPGDYTVVVKVIDILGNDTTKTLRLKVG